MEYVVLIFVLAYLVLRLVPAIKANDLLGIVVNALAIVVILIHVGLRALVP